MFINDTFMNLSTDPNMSEFGVVEEDLMEQWHHNCSLLDVDPIFGVETVFMGVAGVSALAGNSILLAAIRSSPILPPIVKILLGNLTLAFVTYRYAS